MTSKNTNQIGKIYTRPWGTYQTLALENGFQVKIVTVNPGGELSLQKHNRRDEHWVIVKGNPLVTLGKETKIMKPNQHIFIPVTTLHRITNNTEEKIVLVEVQFGDYLGEDDIVRLEDIYGRT
jgi:mannose-6-phosphate isomerase